MIPSLRESIISKIFSPQIKLREQIPEYHQYPKKEGSGSFLFPGADAYQPHFGPYGKQPYQRTLKLEGHRKISDESFHALVNRPADGC